jgi:hypothetical protein
LEENQECLKDIIHIGDLVCRGGEDDGTDGGGGVPITTDIHITHITVITNRAYR